MEESKLKSKKNLEKDEIRLLRWVSHPDCPLSGMASVEWNWHMHVSKLRIKIIASLNFRVGEDLKDCLFSSYSEWHPLTNSFIIFITWNMLEMQSLGQTDWTRIYIYTRFPGDSYVHRSPRNNDEVCTYPIFNASFRSDMHILYFHLSPW